ncbi:MAG: MFS transporter [Candidatus Diapherotrites archaeon]|nr:MFS transporter [Candidatus Diapherotrites archaeon]
MSRKINKNIFTLGFVSLLTDISSEMIFSILPVFMSSVLMIDKSIIGLIEGLAESAASISKLFSAKLERVFKSKKKTILLGYGLSTLVKPLFVFATVWWQILIIRFLDRVGKGIRGPARDAMIADYSNSKNRGISFGFHRMMDTIGAVIGPVFAFLILSLYVKNFNLVFLFSFVPALVALLIIFFFVNEKKIFVIKKESKFIDLEDRNYKFFVFSSSIFALGNMSFAFLLIRIQELGLPIAFVPLAYVLLNISYSFFAIPFGRLADKIGRIKTLSLAFSLFSITFLSFYLFKDVWLAILLLVVYGAATAGVETTQRIIASEIVPRDKRTKAIGLYQGITGLLLLPASLIAGFLWSSFGAEVAFCFSAFTSAIAVILITVFLNFKK